MRAQCLRHSAVLAMLVQVPVYVNKVGPYFNTHETYHYYSLPVCHPNPVSLRLRAALWHQSATM